LLEWTIQTGDIDTCQDAANASNAVDGPLFTRDPREGHVMYNNFFPFAPYDDDELNRQYRLANGIGIR